MEFSGGRTRRSLVDGIGPHKRFRWWLAPLLSVLCWLAGCASAADIQGAGEAAWRERFAQANELFVALEQTAIDRALPIARRDAERRRLTSEWIDEQTPAGPRVRRRYFLAVLVHPQAGIALNARIVRESEQVAPTGESRWSPLDRSPDLAEEETLIVEQARRHWEDER